MYLPAFLLIAKDLNVTPEQVQHTLTFFAAGMAIGQLFWGPVGDSYGRKPIILLGVLVSAVAALILTHIYSIGQFTGFRFIQGFLGQHQWYWLARFYVIYFIKMNYLGSCHQLPWFLC